ncbi:MAG: undecaprenyl-diphosphate phosphatase [Phycisphaerae bacterium]|nr:undecaprenyl-diphosphate phosphatase [Phycisphaerae bacterium]
MTDILRAIVMGIVEGLTEFLPISSTGHMILTAPLLGIPSGDPFWGGVFDIFIQIGAILAVVVYFWRRMWRLTLHPADKPIYEHILVKLFVAFLPAAVVGLLFADFIESKLKFPLPVAAALIVGGFGILLIEWWFTKPKVSDAGRITLGQAFGVGLAQCFSLFPGMSRSASTIMGGLIVGLSAPAAAEFSFFLAIPTMVAAGGYSLLKHLDEVQRQQVLLLAVGFVVSFLVAWVVVAAFMRFIQTHKFRGFAYYRIAVGAVVILAYALWLR